MKRKATTWTVVGFCLLLAAGSALLGSCNKGSEKAREKAAEKLFESMLEKKTGNEAKVDLSAGKIKVESEGTKTEIDQASNVWPEDIPAAVPRFSWGKISGVTKSQSPEGQFWGVNCAEVRPTPPASMTQHSKRQGLNLIS